MPNTRFPWPLLCFVLVGSCKAQAPEPSADTWSSITENGITVETRSSDIGIRAEILRQSLVGRSLVEGFFGATLDSPFTVTVYPNRATMEPEWRVVFNAPSMVFQCWMIANANDSRLLILSPRVWGTETCGHNGNDTAYTRRVLTHEIVHVMHRNRNSDPTFSTLYPAWWLVEGLATLASGQFTEGMRAQAVSTLTASAPTQLENLWAGGAGYGISALLVEYIDVVYGRQKLLSLMTAHNESEILALLATSEQSLLDSWREAVVP